MVQPPEFRDRSPRPNGAVRLALVLLLAPVLVLTNATSWASGAAQAGQQLPQPPAQSEAAFGTITPYLGLAIDEIEFPGVPPDEATALLSATSLKIGDPL